MTTTEVFDSFLEYVILTNWNYVIVLWTSKITCFIFFLQMALLTVPTVNAVWRKHVKTTRYVFQLWILLIYY